MIILINPYAAAGRAMRKWQNIEQFILEKFSPAKVIVLSKQKPIQTYLSNFINEGQRHFVAAGGDGTVNAMLQSIVETTDRRSLRQIKIGAIGLGSSNDFHKPFKKNNLIKTIPYLLDCNSADLRDVGVLSYLTRSGHIENRYWLINASLGITAQANFFFNHPDVILHYLKKSFTHSAILYAALRTIFSYRNRQIEISYNNQQSRTINLTNMGVVKSPHFSGNFAYDTPFQKADGQFYINISRDMHLLNILNLLLNLSRQRFCGLQKTESRSSTHLKVIADRPFAVEFDGEVISTKTAEFNITRKMIGVCTC